MGLQDLIVTPIYLLLLYALAYWVRPKVTNRDTRKYFIPGLTVKFVGAIALGLVYQFYYEGGDTFNYWENGSRWIWEAFWDKPVLGLKLLLEGGGGERMPETFLYSQHIWYYRDPESFAIVRIAGLLDIITLHTYSSTALFFAVFSFSGLWAMFYAVSRKYTEHSKLLAIAILFIPSVVFWGSGILKDTVTIGGLGWLAYSSINLIEFKEISNGWNWLIALLASYVIFSIKAYILICFLPTVFIWLYWKNIVFIEHAVIRIVVAPMMLAVFALAGYFALLQISRYNDEYALGQIAERASITAYDIRYGWGARTGGDGGYDIGIPDGTWLSMITLMPAAINVTLFRPYLWEVRNPLMLFSAVESFAILVLTTYFFLIKKGFVKLFSDPFLVFCFFFSLIFAFAVGVSTANFGTLMRYKIPLMPFFSIALVSMYNLVKRQKRRGVYHQFSKTSMPILESKIVTNDT